MSADDNVQSKIEKAGLKLRELIPEAGFDIICRIIPGFVAVGTLLIVAIGGIHPTSTSPVPGEITWPIILSKVGEAKWPHLLGGLIGAYVIGCMLDFSSNLLFHWVSIWRGWRAIEVGSEPLNRREWKDLQRYLGLDLPTNSSPRTVTCFRQKENILERLRNNFRHSSPSNGAILTKLTAEERLARNLLAGCALCQLVILGRFILDRGGKLSLDAIILVVVLDIILLFAWLDQVPRSGVRAYFWWVEQTRHSREQYWHEQVKSRAYTRWLQNGRQLGRDIEDWQAAEKEVGTEGGASGAEAISS